MSTLSEIQAVLETRLYSFAGGYDIAWPNMEYQPQPGDTFLRPSNLPLRPINVGVADDSSMMRNGIFQIDIFVPKNSGPRAAINIADSLAAHFNRGLELLTATAGFKVRVQSVGVEIGDVVGSHYAVPVLVNYSTVTTE